MMITQPARRRLIRLGAAVLSISTASQIPFSTVVVPAFTVQVVDTVGRAVDGACVSQTWQHYSFEAEGHDAEVKADSAGYAKFPRRTATASLFTRVIAPLRQAGGMHSSFGPHAWIIATAPGQHGSMQLDDLSMRAAPVVVRPAPHFELVPGTIARKCSPARRS